MRKLKIHILREGLRRLRKAKQILPIARAAWQEIEFVQTVAGKLAGELNRELFWSRVQKIRRTHQKVLGEWFRLD